MEKREFIPDDNSRLESEGLIIRNVKLTEIDDLIISNLRNK